MSLEIRMAGPGDVDAIAELHAASWRSTYRGVFADAYLDGDLLPERRQHWLARLETAPRPDQAVLVALEDGACVGFLCLYLDGEPGWGPLLDNFHVRPDRKGGGIGRQLLQQALAWMSTRGHFDRWHLWVVEANAASRRVYQHLGWKPEQRAIHRAPDGTPYAVWRYSQRIPAGPRP